MFKTALQRLTLWYLCIIMLLSVGFSISLYNVSTRELNDSQKQLESLLEQSFFPGMRAPNNFQEFNRVRLQQIVDSRNKIKWNLISYNIVIVLAGAAASYFLAKRTLEPIESNLEAQARFTSDASHELRTPLTAMKSEIEVALRSDELSIKDAKNLLTSNLEEIDKLESLSAGLLKLAQNDKTLPVEPCPINEIIEEAQGRVESAAKLKQISFQIKTDDEVVMGERWSLVELFSLLLDNAIKYSPKQTKILIAAETKPRTKQVGISIQDHGYGIAATDIPHIFDRFYRADRSRSKEVIPGYGLGLSIAKKIVDLHHGRIEVHSQLGKGSKFTIWLPVV